ncbi:hypothetical protein ZWY2020_051050 [Hordeum vulgare]|nr:hypothetical protein ZWY2020_051050 [Hordeum vulgare]
MSKKRSMAHLNSISLLLEKRHRYCLHTAQLVLIGTKPITNYFGKVYSNTNPDESSISRYIMQIERPKAENMSSRVDDSELRKVFQMFDKNGDGQITKKELRESLKNLGIYIPEDEMDATMAKIDTNGDGCVDIEEFGLLYRSILDESEGPNGGNMSDEEEAMREAFCVFDQNGDGYITIEELRSVLASLGLKQGRTIEECRQMISKVDANGDGRVDFKEFKQMMRGGGFAAIGRS